MRIKKFDKYDILEVQWVDIVERSGWHRVKDAEKAEGMKVLSIGYFLNNHKGSINLASTVSKDEDCNVLTIPWGCIFKITKLGYADGEC